MKEITIKIQATFGSRFQERIARDSLMGMLKAWYKYMNHSHKKNWIDITIGNDAIDVLEWFNFEKKK